MGRDPAQGVINWFAALMFGLGIICLGTLGFVLYAAWRFYRAVMGT